MRHDADSGDAGTAASIGYSHAQVRAQSATASPSTLYTCPMASHADVVSDKPGKCPKCEMDLVPTSTVPMKDRGGKLAQTASVASVPATPHAATPTLSAQGFPCSRASSIFRSRTSSSSCWGRSRWCWAAFTRVKNIPLDAIPDLSDVQVIVYTEWPGQAPQIVQDQVTYPDHHQDALGAQGESRARLLVLRLFVRLYHF